MQDPRCLAGFSVTSAAWTATKPAGYRKFSQQLRIRSFFGEPESICDAFDKQGEKKKGIYVAQDAAANVMGQACLREIVFIYN